MSTDPNPTRPRPEGDGRVFDATDRNWVDRFMPGWSRPWLRLSRADRPAGTWLLLLPCWWSIALAAAADPAGLGPLDLHLALGCAVGAFLMRGAGCTWNDWADRNIDGGVARTRSRPIPSGQVTARGALAWMVAQALIAFGVLLTFPTPAIWLGIAALGPVCIYPFMKRFTWWPQIFLGLAFNWGALLGWTAHTGSIGWPAVVLYLAGIAWTLFYDTIYACQDKEDDAIVGVKSTARLFGPATGRALTVFAVAATALAAAAAVLGTAAAGAPPLATALALAGAAGFGLRLARQRRGFDPDDDSGNLVRFRDARAAGLRLAVGFGAAALV